MSTPRRRALARLSSPRFRSDDDDDPRSPTDPRRRALARRLIARSSAHVAPSLRLADGAALRHGLELRRMRPIHPGDPAPLLIRLVRRPFALSTARTVRRPAREPVPALERPRALRSGELTGGLVQAVRSARALRDAARPRPAFAPPRARRAAAPDPIRFDADPAEVAP